MDALIHILSLKKLHENLRLRACQKLERLMCRIEKSIEKKKKQAAS